MKCTLGLKGLQTRRLGSVCVLHHVCKTGSKPTHFPYSLSHLCDSNSICLTGPLRMHNDCTTTAHYTSVLLSPSILTLTEISLCLNLDILPKAEIAKVNKSFAQVEVQILVFKNTLVKVEVLTKLLYSSKSKEVWASKCT